MNLYQHPPINARELAKIPGYEPDNQPLQGLLADFVGPQYPADTMEDLDCYDREEFVLLKLVRAFPVPCLMNQSFTVANPIGAIAGLMNLIRTRLPHICWNEDPEPSIGALHKYGLLHTSIAAPPDLATGQNMALELCGYITYFNNVEFESAQGQEYINQLRMIDWIDPKTTLYPDWLQSITIEIKQATYANICYPGINVPLYS
jgi:hypothetical protein